MQVDSSTACSLTVLMVHSSSLELSDNDVRSKTKNNRNLKVILVNQNFVVASSTHVSWFIFREAFDLHLILSLDCSND